MIKISPSILSADFMQMGEAIKTIEKSGADYIHCDIMDGLFVPNITFGFNMIADIKKISNLPIDAHLMIEKPERYIERFCKAGCDIITVHQEATVHLHRTVQAIKSCGVKAGVALNPMTPLSTLEYMLEDLDMALLMSVNPGYSAQSFIPAVMNKIKQLDKMIKATGKEIELEVDGGVNPSNIKEVTEAGANVIVAGNAFFAAEDPCKAVKILKGE